MKISFTLCQNRPALLSCGTGQVQICTLSPTGQFFQNPNFCVHSSRALGDTAFIQRAKPNPIPFFQTYMWGGWNSVLPEPRPALGCRSRCSAPLLPLRRLRLLAGLSLPDGLLLSIHADVFQPSDPSDTGAKRDPGLAQEAALAQVLPCLQTAHHGKGRAGNGGKQPAFK